MDKSFSSVGKVPRVKGFQAIVFHDRDGKIHHIHHVIVLEGSRPVEHETMKQQACKQAEMLGVDVSQLKTLHVSELQKPHVMHRVDMKRKKLVEVEAPKPDFTNQHSIKSLIVRWMRTVRRWFRSMPV